MDFRLATLPTAEPLQHSHTGSQIEGELKELFAELFGLVGKDTFDAGVLGAAHLGSFDLVQKMVNHDGLVLLKGTREESATRYLYRAWKSGDVQKRGLHFVRTYLQLLFPGESSVQQMWHDKRFPYGEAFVGKGARDPYWFNFLGQPGLKLDGAWKVGRTLMADLPVVPEYTPDEENLFLTSRIEILLGLEALAGGENPLDGVRKPATSGLLEVIRAVIPARLVPVFRFWLRFVLGVQVRASSFLLMQKAARQRYPWCGRVVTSETDAIWRLSLQGEAVKLPSPFGTFRLGELRGAKTNWKLKACRAAALLNMTSESSAVVYRLPQLGERGRHLNGAWSLGRPQAEALSWSGLAKDVELGHELSQDTTFHERICLGLIPTTRLGAAWKLGAGWRLNGENRLALSREPRKLNGGFRLGRPGVAVDYLGDYQISGNAPAHRVPRVGERRWRLDGGWRVGGYRDEAASLLVGTKDIQLDQTVTPDQVTFDEEITFDYPASPTRIGRVWWLGGGWRIGASMRVGQAVTGRKLGSFGLLRDRITVEGESALFIDGEASTRATIKLPRQSVNTLRYWNRPLDGLWSLGAFTRFGDFKLDGAALRSRKMRDARKIGGFTLSPNELAGMEDFGFSQHLPLNGSWKLGAIARPEFRLTITRA